MTKCSTILQNKLQPKLKNLGIITIPCTLGNYHIERALCDSRVEINFTPLSIFNKLGVGKLKSSNSTFQFADKFLKKASGVVEDLLAKVGNFVFPFNFNVLDLKVDHVVFMILSRSLFTTNGGLIDVALEYFSLRLNDEHIKFNLYEMMKHPKPSFSIPCFQVDLLKDLLRNFK